MLDIAAELYRARTERGISAELAGKLIRVSQATFSRYERAEKVPPPWRAPDIAAFTGCDEGEVRETLEAFEAVVENGRVIAVRTGSYAKKPVDLSYELRRFERDFTGMVARMGRLEEAVSQLEQTLRSRRRK